LPYLTGEVTVGEQHALKRWTDKMVIVIRQARADDAEAIAGVHIDSWRAAYRDQMPDQILNALDVKERAQQWREWLEIPELSAFVATVDGLVAGFCCLGPSRDNDAQDTVGEIPTVYVLPSHWRQGIGRLLCERTFTEARNRGFAEVSLWVLDSNERGRRFYESLGFRTDGKTKTDAQLTGAPLREIRYRRGVL
jgi:ribosomal protein S18 acetylase RimI-like enzyme